MRIIESQPRSSSLASEKIRIGDENIWRSKSIYKRLWISSLIHRNKDLDEKKYHPTISLIGSSNIDIVYFGFWYLLLPPRGLLELDLQLLFSDLRILGNEAGNRGSVLKVLDESSDDGDVQQWPNHHHLPMEDPPKLQTLFLDFRISKVEHTMKIPFKRFWI
jgi:hypothetical protein